MKLIEKSIKENCNKKILGHSKSSNLLRVIAKFEKSYKEASGVFDNLINKKDTLKKIFKFFADLTLITELREHKTYNVPQQKDIDDKLDNEFHQLGEDLGLVMHKKTVS